MYNREATEYDIKHVDKYNDDFNTTLIFVRSLPGPPVNYCLCLVSQAGLFSAVSSAFVIDIYPKLQPDPGDQSVALLRAILLTLNQSAIPNESPVVPPVRERPPSEIVATTALLYASLLISLLAAFLAMLGKQWLSRYLQHTGGSMTARCRDRQRKFDGLQRWRFHVVVESPPVMLQIALLLLASALCQYMASVDPTIYAVLLSLTLPGFALYSGMVIIGTASYEFPFQTPLSTLFRYMWRKVKPRLIPAASSIVVTLRTWEKTLRGRISEIHSSIVNIYPGSLRTPLPTIRGDPHPPEIRPIIPWFETEELDRIQMKNTVEVRCVSWILRKITDPEAIDIAVQLARTVRWFEHGTGKEPPYDQILSIFHTCFGSSGEVHPGLRDRAYHSARALLWIHTLLVCKLREFTRAFLPPPAKYAASVLDHDLAHLLVVNTSTSFNDRFTRLLQTREGHSPQHSQWISNVLLHLSFAAHHAFDFRWIYDSRFFMHNANVPSGAMLNGLLMCCSFLGSPVVEEALIIQDKSYVMFHFCLEAAYLRFNSDHLEKVLHQVDEAIVSALSNAHPGRKLVEHVLSSLTKLENHPECLTGMAHKWCTVISENRRGYEGWGSLFSLSLEICSRHPGQDHLQTSSHINLDQGLIDAVFECNDDKAVAHLLCIFTVHPPMGTVTSICAKHIANLHVDLASPRLRRLVICSVELIGYEGFREVETGKFVNLLNNLQIGIEDIDLKSAWASILLETVQHTKGVQHLAIQSWELLVELATEWTRISEDEDPEYVSRVTDSLLRAQEWDKLECWVGAVWMTWPPEAEDAIEDLTRTMESLFRRRPSAVQKLTQLMEQWGKEWHEEVPKPFQEICDKATG